MEAVRLDCNYECGQVFLNAIKNDIKKLKICIENQNARFTNRQKSCIINMNTKYNTDGGAGSGNFGHAGRIGEVGGSAPSDGSGGGDTIENINNAISSNDEDAIKSALKNMKAGTSIQLVNPQDGSLAELVTKKEDGTFSVSDPDGADAINSTIDGVASVLSYGYTVKEHVDISDLEEAVNASDGAEIEDALDNLQEGTSIAVYQDGQIQSYLCKNSDGTFDVYDTEGVKLFSKQGVGDASDNLLYNVDKIELADVPKVSNDTIDAALNDAKYWASVEDDKDMAMSAADSIPIGTSWKVDVFENNSDNVLLDHITSIEKSGEDMYKAYDKNGELIWGGDTIEFLNSFASNPDMELNLPSESNNEEEQTEVSFNLNAYEARKQPIPFNELVDNNPSMSKFEDIPIPYSRLDAWNTLQPTAGKVWDEAEPEEHLALKKYTGNSYDEINNALRYPEQDSSERINQYTNNLTKMIDKCELEHDTQLVRGIGYHALANMARDLDLDSDDYKNMTSKQLNDALTDETLVEKGFASCGSSQDTGFSEKPVQLHIIAPKGTKAMYVEAYSSAGKDLDETPQYAVKHISGENETIIQQGTTFKCLGATNDEEGTTHVYLEVKAQQPIYK